MTNRWGAGPRDTVLHALERAVSESPAECFLDFAGTTYSFADIDRLSTRLGNSLLAWGLKRGERVATFLENGVDVIVSWLAITKIGAIWVPVNVAFKGEFLRHPLADSGARVVICESEFVERLVSLTEKLPELDLILAREGVHGHVASGARLDSLEDYRGEDDSPIRLEASPADLAALMYTSGTTGPSKACMISHNYFCHIGRRGAELVDLRGDETVWTCLPLFHASAMQAVIAALQLKGRVSIARRFSLSKFWDEIELSGASVAKIMASMVPLLATAPDNEAMKRCHGQLRAVTGNPFTLEQKKIFRERFGVKYIASNQYASTEGYCLTSVPYGTESPANSAGKRNDDYEVILMGDDGCEVEPGEPGELVFRPRHPNIMSEGYWNRPEETVQAFRGLWMHTGDVGRFDEEGFFYFVDRKKDYIRRRGENVSSWEMEKTFMEHDDVQEVAFHSVPSDLSEDDIKITVVLEPDATLTEEDLWAWSVDRLPAFALPRYVEFRSELPKNGVGRVLKFELRAEGRTSATWDVEETDLARRR